VLDYTFFRRNLVRGSPTAHPERWARVIRFFGLVPTIVGEHRWGSAVFTAIATDWRRCSIPTVLQRATDMAAAIASAAGTE